MQMRLLAALALSAVVLVAGPVLPQSPTPTPTPTPRLAFGWDPVRATLSAAMPHSSTRGFDPVLATLQAAYPRSQTPVPGLTATATPTPLSYTRGYDPLFLTMQAWAGHRIATEAPCAWMWTSQPLPDLTGRVQTEIDTAGADAVTFAASAYGENCLEADGQTVRHTIEHDVVYRLQVAGSEAAALGDALALALPIVARHARTEARLVTEINLLFPDASLDPIRLTPAMLDRVFVVDDLGGAALVARLYTVALR